MGLAEKKVKVYLDKIKKEDKRINSFLQLNGSAISEAREIDERVSRTGKKGRLYGYVIGVKSNINVKGMIASCASKTLEGYKSSYDATVIEKIKREDGVILGILNCDEFASGISGENSAFGATQNPAVKGYIPGGSSSGSAAAVAAEFCDASLGSDTGGSIRNPAGHCGVVGVKPSYGLVSRYGLIDLSMSLDQIGPVAKSVKDAMLILDVIKGKDEKDCMSVESNEIRLEDLKNKKIKIGFLKVKGIDREVDKLCNEFRGKVVKKYNWSSEEVEIKNIELAVETYYPMVYSEFFSATRRFDGRRYGKKIEDNSGEEVLRRIFGGKEITKAELNDKYYQRALEVKNLVKLEFEKAFENVDCIVLPNCPILPWKIGESKKMDIEQIYAADALTTPSNLAEICAITIPAGKIGNIPVGVQIICKRLEEGKMFGIAKCFEDVLE